MIELRRDTLVFSFPEVHPEARLEIEFQRTLRIPDDGKAYPLPPGLGRFPLCHVDDHAERVPGSWLDRGGVMLPMYQSEALWLAFRPGYVEDRDAEYPFAIKVAAGKINAVTGDSWVDGLHGVPQDYAVAPTQPWLDGYCVEKGYIRQFVAAPLGSGYSAEEQLTGEAQHGGLQLAVYPMKREAFERRFPKRNRPKVFLHRRSEAMVCEEAMPCSPDMGLAPGGRMRQEVYEDPFKLADWEQEQRGRCFVHLTNSLVWRAITGAAPPLVPPTAKEYERAGLPWFDYYSDSAAALEGSKALSGLKSVVVLGAEKKQVPLPENESVTPARVVKLRAGLRVGQVREGAF